MAAIDDRDDSYAGSVRRTSKMAYDEITENGLLSSARWRSYNDLYHYGPSTAREQEARTGDCNGHRRLRDLVDLGVAEEVGTRICRVTGMEVVLWDVTIDLPRQTSERAKGPCRPSRADLILTEQLLDGYMRNHPMMNSNVRNSLTTVLKWISHQCKRRR